MLKEDRKDGLGTASLTPEHPVSAGSRQILVLRYRAGELGLQAGGALRITIPHGFTSPQIDEFYKDGFVTATCSRAEAELKLHLESKIFCAYRPEISHSGAFGKSLFITVEQADLLPGDVIDITYGDTRYYGQEPWGPNPPEAPELSGQHELTVAVDPDGSRSAPLTGFYLLPHSPALTVLPADAATLLPILPSNIEENQEIVLRIVPLDPHLNPTAVSSASLPYQICSPQSERVEEETSADSIALCPAPGERRYEVYTVRCAGHPAVDGISNPAKFGKYQGAYSLYWGDLHAHSMFSDGLGRPEDVLRYARDIARLDFSALSDHDDIGPYLSEEEWAETCRAIAAFHDPGRFVTFLGYEYRPGLADMNVYYPGDEGALMSGRDARWNRPSKIAPEVKRSGGMIIPHMHFGADWEGYDPALYRVMEVYSQHGSAEYLGCPRQIPYLTHQLQKSSASNQQTTLQEILALGMKMGVTAGSDTHSGRPGLSNWTRVTRTYQGGLTAVFAREKTRELLWEAMYDRHCYATTGPRIYLEFSINGAPMGSEIQASRREIDAYAIGTNAITRLDVIKNNRILSSAEGSQAECSVSFTDSAQTEEDFYYIRLTQQDGEMAWSSPIWVKG